MRTYERAAVITNSFLNSGLADAAKFHFYGTIESKA